jgi:hypothetical protein
LGFSVSFLAALGFELRALPLESHLQQGDKHVKEILVLVAHACNPSYSGGRDQEDGSLKPA